MAGTEYTSDVEPLPLYYNPQQAILKAALNFQHTCFQNVWKKSEFWAFVLIHVFLISLTHALGYDTKRLQALPAESAAIVQFFMTFFLTFYNKHCFARYNKLYTECMNLMDGVLLFVYEMTVSFNYDELRPHRTLAVKYILATMYTFFMTLTGGELTPDEWEEVLRKGLLTKPERDSLAYYPGIHLTLVLTNWAMQVVDQALDKDCLWTKRSERIAHVHNRLNMNILRILNACHNIGHIVALPVPFPYFHLMNMVLVLNFLLLACVLALFQSFLTILPYCMVVSIFMGLRDVATQLADPFGDEDFDFPVAHFLTYTFDQAVAMNEAFGPIERLTIRQSIKEEEGFRDAHLLRRCDKARLHMPEALKMRDNPHMWHNTGCFFRFQSEASVIGHVRDVLKPRREWEPDEMSMDEHAKAMAAIESQIEDVQQHAQKLENELQEVEIDIENLEAEAAGKAPVAALENVDVSKDDTHAADARSVDVDQRKVAGKRRDSPDFGSARETIREALESTGGLFAEELAGPPEEEPGARPPPRLARGRHGQVAADAGHSSGNFGQPNVCAATSSSRPMVAGLRASALDAGKHCGPGATQVSAALDAPAGHGGDMVLTGAPGAASSHPGGGDGTELASFATFEEARARIRRVLETTGDACDLSRPVLETTGDASDLSGQTASI